MSTKKLYPTMKTPKIPIYSKWINSAYSLYMLLRIVPGSMGEGVSMCVKGTCQGDGGLTICWRNCNATLAMAAMCFIPALQNIAAHSSHVAHHFVLYSHASKYRIINYRIYEKYAEWTKAFPPGSVLVPRSGRQSRRSYSNRKTRLPACLSDPVPT